MGMNEFESIDDLLNYITDNSDTILKNVNYNEADPEGIIKEQEMNELQEMLNEMVEQGLIKIIGTNADGENIYERPDNV